MFSDPSIRVVVEDLDTPMDIEDVVYKLAWEVAAQLMVDLFVHDQPIDDIHVREVIADGYMYLLEMGRLPNVLNDDGHRGNNWGFSQLCMSLVDHHCQTLFGILNHAEKTVVILPSIHGIHVQKTRHSRVVSLLIHHRLLLQHAVIPQDKTTDDALSAIYTFF